MGTTISDPLVGHLVDGRYEVVSRIARGGMATVYLAVDRRLDREVALKVMHPHLAEGASGTAFVARFRREARAAARLTHPGLVGVYDQGIDGDTSYLTMEYVDGTNLRRHLGERGSLSVGESFAVLESVLDALAAAHRSGLVHRDVKPENVLLASDGRVKLTDFGLARAVTEVTSTTTGTVLGTVAYLGPELVSRGLSDTRTDVYAAGILLYEMITGRQPFTGETPIQVAFQHVNSDIPAPSRAVDWLPQEVDELVAALAAREPDDRPADAGAALALVRRTRTSLDEATLGRRADVAPTITLHPATVDPEAQPAEQAGPGDDRRPRTGATARIDVDDHGSTVALPIGAGVRTEQERAADDRRATAPARRRRRLVWALVLALVVALVTAGGWWFVTLGPGAFTTVPDVVGEEQAAATEELTAAGLEVDAVEAFDEEAAGTVIASAPDPGAAVRRDGTVEITVSRGPEMTTVPADLVGATSEAAQEALQTAGLVLGETQAVYDDDVPEGAVMAVSPEGGTELPKGDEVVLTVSRGPAPVTIPQVIGATRDQATEDLESEGLAVEVTEAYSDTVPAGSVIEQSPVQGTAGRRGDVVTVVVSLGPELIEVPDVVGEQYAAAAERLTALGFVPSRENVLGGFFGTVRQQSVEGGDRVPRGTTIRLTVV
ncbi:Stk1 family PASTA domain-containing Ser/Thr kinase [uncultured Cellulomonas sp.]|uniref:Stk1 family PASTA domain-containing Ser/Thr kinase n=1 Tax=uncultured Cellulomonas sp. TaxID=189682 RepID=UPI00260788CB|nr:Stk1 family PASTA domain-containing Ser/Thr kinase [uncultured Cellulomonas sp.]